MKNLLISLASIFLSFLNSVNAEIVSTTSLEPIETSIREANADTLVLFDVKAVLITAEDQILTPQHKAEFRNIRDKIKQNYSPEEFEKLVSIILAEQKLVLVDKHILDMLANLKRQNIKAIALTSGYTGKYGNIEKREDLRIQKLKDVGIDFTYAFPQAAPIIFQNIKGANSSCFPMFKNGVIFTCHLPKDDPLKYFLDLISFKPKKIIFVDNQLKNIKVIESYCKTAGIEFEGYEYLAVKNRPKTALNTKLVDYQMYVLEKEHKWLSDCEIIKRLAKK